MGDCHFLSIRDKLIQSRDTMEPVSALVLPTVDRMRTTVTLEPK